MFALTAPAAFSILSLHDALPIYMHLQANDVDARHLRGAFVKRGRIVEGDAEFVLMRAGRNVFVRVRINIGVHAQDRKSTRLNSSHEWISYAVFCLKNKRLK